MELETTPSEICKALGYALPNDLKKYDPDQPRDTHGRWGTGGGKESGQAGSSSRSDGTLTEGRSAAAPNKEPKTPASTPPPEKHVRRIDIQISGGTRQDSATGGIIPGALYAQLARQPIVTEEVL